MACPPTWRMCSAPPFYVKRVYNVPSTRRTSIVCSVLRTLTFGMRNTGVHHLQHPVCAGCEDRSTSFEPADEATLYRDRLSTSVTDELSPPSIAGSLRQAWHAAQQADPELAPYFESLPATFRLHPGDHILERSVKHPGLDMTSWVPVVPSGQATPLLSWRRWVWQAHHSSPLGAHRSADATIALLRRIVWWPHLARDVQGWHEHCVTCSKLRREPRKAPQTAVPGSVYDPWQEIVVDMEGPLTPPSVEGHRYIMTYMCNFCGGILLEHVRTLQAAEVRAAFSRCLFRSGTLPVLLRTDRGPEFTNALFSEYLTLMGIRQRLGTAYRPCEQGKVERIHREVQRALAILVTDLVHVSDNQWHLQLPAVEYLVYNTPKSHGLTPRDLDRQWSIASPLAKDLRPFVPLADLRKTNSCAKFFVNYSALRHTVREAQARASLASATRANRFRPTRVVQEGDLIMYRDPRAQRAGGRTPWAKGLAGPATVVEITGNTVQVRTTDGVTVRGIHLDDLVVVPPDDSTSAPSPLALEPDPHPVSASSSPAPTVALPKRTLKYYQQLLVGAHIAYSSAEHPDRTFRVGKVTHLMQAELSCAVHRMGALQDGRLRVRFQLLYIDAEGMETTTGLSPPLSKFLPHGLSVKSTFCRKAICGIQKHARSISKIGVWRPRPFRRRAIPCRRLRLSGIPQPLAGRSYTMEPRDPLQLRNPHAFASPPRTHCSIACPPAMSNFWKFSPAVAN